VRKVIAKVRAACAKNGRAAPRFSLSFRPILADTEEKAWAKAEATLARAKAVQDKTGFVRKPGGPANEGSKRLLALAAQGERLDKRLWTGMAALTDARGNSTSLVGTPQQVAESLAEYYDLGIDIFLIRGFDPLIDAIEYGRELIPLTRKLVAERARTRSLAAE
jgi:alkanesulfonate monooxygenase